MLAVKGTIIPSTLQDVTLVASINGSTVEGESKIPKQNAPISQVFLKPDGAAGNPEAAQAILNAELVVIGPGSLYTSILPNLLVEGMVEAIKASPALKVYICNLASQHGETDGYDVDDYLRVIHEHVGANIFDFVLVNSNNSHTPTGGQSQVIFRPEDSTQAPRGPLHRRRRGQRSDAFAPRPRQARPHDHAEGVAGVALAARRARRRLNASTMIAATAT